MMIVKKLGILLICVFVGLNVQAQFLQKLKEKTQRAIEDEIINKSADKAADETGEAMDDVLSPKNGENDSDEDEVKNLPSFRIGSKVDPSFKNNKYNYTWKYSLTMDSRKDDIEMDYYLLEDGTDCAMIYNSTKISGGMEGMISIMDEKNNFIASVFEMNGSKSGTLIAMDFDELSDVEDEVSDYTMKEIGTKTILGYECQGYQMENDENIIISYLATDMPVSLSNVLGGTQQKNFPKGFSKELFDKVGEDSLIMEMEYTDKKEDKNNFTTYCTALKKE